MAVDRILVNVLDMPFIVNGISNSMITESSLPNFKVGIELEFGLMRKAPFNELDRAFQAGDWRNDQMEVVRHDHQLVQ
jgi:hypothetical protein